MSPQPPPPDPSLVQLSVPPDKIAGYYANVVSVWNTPYDFAMDFCINMPYAAGPAGETVAEVVARIRIPPTLVFDLLRALNQNLGEYEEAYGQLKRPGELGEEHHDKESS